MLTDFRTSLFDTGPKETYFGEYDEYGEEVNTLDCDSSIRGFESRYSP